MRYTQAQILYKAYFTLNKNTVNHLFKVEDLLIEVQPHAYNIEDCSEILRRLIDVNVKWFLIGDGSVIKSQLVKSTYHRPKVIVCHAHIKRFLIFAVNACLFYTQFT